LCAWSTLPTPLTIGGRFFFVSPQPPFFFGIGTSPTWPSFQSPFFFRLRFWCLFHESNCFFFSCYGLLPPPGPGAVDCPPSRGLQHVQFPIPALMFGQEPLDVRTEPSPWSPLAPLYAVPCMFFSLSLFFLFPPTPPLRSITRVRHPCFSTPCSTSFIFFFRCSPVLPFALEATSLPGLHPSPVPRFVFLNLFFFF